MLQAEPTALLRMCQLRREFALGGQAARRFALPEAEARPRVAGFLHGNPTLGACKDVCLRLL